MCHTEMYDLYCANHKSRLVKKKHISEVYCDPVFKSNLEWGSCGQEIKQWVKPPVYTALCKECAPAPAPGST